MLTLRPGVVRAVRLVSSAPGSGGTQGTTSKPPPSSSSSGSKPSRGEQSTDPGKYNSSDYYAHGVYSYYDIDAQAQKYRLVQPSKFDPLKPKK